MEKIVTRRATAETRLKCVTREQDAVHPGVLTGGLVQLVIKVRTNILNHQRITGVDTNIDQQ